MTQVGDDSCADVWRNWHPCSLPALDADAHVTGSPVDIVQCEGRDLVSSQAELGEHHKDCVVPPPNGGCSITTIERFLHLLGRQIGRQVRELPSSDRGYAAGQREPVQSFVMKISEKCTQ